MIKPRWEHARVDQVAHSQIQEWVATTEKSASWTRDAYNVLSQILGMAVKDGMIRKNPAAGVKLPRRDKPRKVYLTMEQLELFADECGERKDLILLLGTSGLRWGEAIALRPCDLNPLRNRIQVTRSASKAGNDIILGTPKTHEQRSVAVAPHVMEMLVRRSETVASDELLWTGVRGGWLRPPGHRTWFDGALKRAQAADPTIPRFTPHGLRHVAAGLLIQAGANVKVVQRQLGHASAAMTLDQYADLWDDGLDEIVAVLSPRRDDSARRGIVVEGVKNDMFEQVK